MIGNYALDTTLLGSRYDIQLLKEKGKGLVYWLIGNYGVDTTLLESRC